MRPLKSVSYLFSTFHKSNIVPLSVSVCIDNLLALLRSKRVRFLIDANSNHLVASEVDFYIFRSVPSRGLVI